jgi:hypothetical protein
LVIGGGINAGSPFTLDQFLYVSNTNPPAASSYPGLTRGTNAVELNGTQAPKANRNTIAGGNSILAASTDAVVFGWNNTAGTASSPVTAHIVIGSALTGASTTAIILVGGSIADGGSAAAIKIGSGLGGLTNGHVGIGFSQTLGGASNGVSVGNSITITGGNNAIVYGAGSDGGTNTATFGQGSGGATQNTLFLGNGISVTGGGSTTGIAVGMSITGTGVNNAITIGHQADYLAGFITLGNNNLGGGGFSTTLLLGGAQSHTTATAVPAFDVRLKNALGTNIAAGDFTVTGPRATGNAASGAIIFQTGLVGASSATLQTATSVFRITAAQKAEVMLDNGLAFVNQTSGAGAGAGTLTNAPSAGNPSHWLRVLINGANRFIPCWT